jgi:hypothetical protein
MRKVVFGGANSLDNYFARKHHSTDWLRWSDEVAAVTADYWKTFTSTPLHETRSAGGPCGSTLST